MYLELAKTWQRQGVIVLTSSDKDGPRYNTTELGRAWVNAICNVPLPTIAYLDEMGRPL